MAYRKRIFLNPISDGAPAFIQAVADSSDDGSYVLGNYLLIVTDCERRIMLTFPLSSKKARAKARAKIDRLAAVVNKFREPDDQRTGVNRQCRNSHCAEP